MESSKRPYVEICFRPTVDTITSARRFVASVYAPFFDDGDLTSRCAMVAHELLENALKYSTDGHTLIRIALSRREPPLSLVVETRNRISDESRAGLDAVFAAMADAGDAHAHYQHLIRRTRDLRVGSCLGLARIWAEGEMTLSHSYEGDVVRISATTVIEASSEAGGRTS